MDALLDAFFAHYRPEAEEMTAWGEMQLRVTTYLCDVLPPLAAITSVRGIILREGEILVVRDPESVHIQPGGRREPGETLDQTLRREVLEETGWTIDQPQLIGVKRFRHLTPKPDGYRYPYPMFLQAIFCARAIDYLPAARESGGYELAAGFVPLVMVQQLPLTEGERVLLAAALDKRTTEERRERRGV